MAVTVIVILVIVAGIIAAITGGVKILMAACVGFVIGLLVQEFLGSVIVGIAAVIGFTISATVIPIAFAVFGAAYSILN